MRRALALSVAALLMLLVALPAGADDHRGDRNETRDFSADVLSGANEVPANDSEGTGKAIFRLNRDEDVLTFKLIATLEDVIQAHIHCGPADANGPVVAFLFGPADPTVDSVGPLSHGFITDGQIIAVPDSDVCPGGVATLDDLTAQMRAGNTYVNVHTTSFPPGEIRGQIR